VRGASKKTAMQNSQASIPSVFVSHGAPLFAVDPGSTGPALRQWTQSLRSAHAVQALVVMSPHWMAHAPLVMSNATPATWHDFGGFPPELYTLQYPAKGKPELAARVLALFDEAGIASTLDERRPLDHGTWVPLMHMLPAADVPVLQVALPAGWRPEQVLALGRALAPLRSEGVLIMGSGSMTHNLAEFAGAGEREAAPYVAEFCRWIEEQVSRQNLPALLDYEAQAPNALRAHPSDDHFLPLFFALGAAGEQYASHYISREVRYGMLAMDAVAFQ
jgi:4,5-DOPA dioxygenase extradiol